MSTADWNAALELARERWAVYNDFDLHDESWFDLFNQFGAPTVLEACKCMKNARDCRPEKKFYFLVANCEKIHTQNPRSNRIR